MESFEDFPIGGVPVQDDIKASDEDFPAGGIPVEEFPIGGVPVENDFPIGGMSIPEEPEEPAESVIPVEEPVVEQIPVEEPSVIEEKSSVGEKPEKSGKGVKIAVAIVLLVLLAGGAGVFAYMTLGNFGGAEQQVAEIKSSAEPTPIATPEPTPEVTPEPTLEPTPEPTTEPTVDELSEEFDWLVDVTEIKGKNKNAVRKSVRDILTSRDNWLPIFDKIKKAVKKHVVIEYRYSSAVKKGRIIETSPKSGEVDILKEKITVYISKGRKRSSASHDSGGHSSGGGNSGGGSSGGHSGGGHSGGGSGNDDLI